MLTYMCSMFSSLIDEKRRYVIWINKNPNVNVTRKYYKKKMIIIRNYILFVDVWEDGWMNGWMEGRRIFMNVPFLIAVDLLVR